MRVSTVLIVSVMVSACYSYLPAERSILRPGTVVRAELTDSGSLVLSSYLGPGTASVDGELLSASDDSLKLAVTAATNRRGIENFWSGEQVVLPRAVISTLRERRLSPVRTALAFGGGLAAAVGVYIGFKSGGLGDKGGGSGGGPPK